MGHQGGHKVESRDWGLFFGGVALAVVGLILMLWPGLTLVSIAAVAGIMLLVAGVFDAVTYFRMRGTDMVSGWALASAACDIILGVMFLIHPLVAAAVVPWVVGVFVIAYGIFAIYAGVKLREAGPGWGVMLANGIVAVLCGLAFIIMPASFAIFLGVYLVVRGASMAVFGVMSPAV